MFPRSLQQCGAYLTEDSAVLLTQGIDARGRGAQGAAERRRSRSLRECGGEACSSRKGHAESVYTDAQAAKLAPQKLFLRISSLQSDEWTQIKEVLRTQPGDTPVYLYPTDTKKKTLAARRYWCKPDIAFLTRLRFLLREEDVIIQ